MYWNCNFTFDVWYTWSITLSVVLHNFTNKRKLLGEGTGLLGGGGKLEVWELVVGKGNMGDFA